MACFGKYARMFRSPDWELIRAAATARLDPGEQVMAVFGALIPHQVSIGHLIAPELAPLIRLMDHAVWRHQARTASRSAQVPLAPRMIIAFTGRRLVIWAARRRWRLGKVIGDLPRDRIMQVVTATGTGTRSRLMVLHLSDGRTVTLQVSARVATGLARTISGDLPDPL